MTIIKKITNFYRMYKSAKYYGLTFHGRKNFNIPSSLKIKNNNQSISVPAEEGAFIDFVSIFIEDAYNLKHFNKSVSSILDIGGNLGFYSMAARHNFPNAKIHMYEPNPNLIEHIEININNLDITFHTEAVGNSTESIRLDFRGDSNQTRTDFSQTGSTKQIPLIEAINRMKGNVDLAKIDCEGAEWEMFKNSEPWRNIKWLAMEYHLWDNHSESEVSHIIHELGFEILEMTPMGDYGHIWAKNKNIE